EFTGLADGDHTVTVIDNNSCETISSFEITSPDSISINLLSYQDTNCGQANGAVDVEVTGGTGQYQYDWSNELGELVSENQDLAAIASGTYQLLVMDNNNCQKQFEVSISDSDGPQISIDNITSPSCSYNSDGLAEIGISGGATPYQILWENGQSDFVATDLGGGTHTVQATDNNGCISFLEINISAPQAINIADKQLVQPDCYGESNGAISISGEGGTGALSYSWESYGNDQSLNNISAGDYQLTIEDENGCVYQEVVILDQPDSISIDFQITPPMCNESNDGSVQIDINGGITPYSIYLNGELQTSHYLQNLATGLYEVEVSDQNTCSESTILEIPEVGPLALEFEDIVLCEGQTYQVLSPIEATSYNWYWQSQVIGTAENIEIQEEGQYQLEVITQEGCIGNGIFQVSFSDEILEGDFLMSSKAFVGDTLIVIDITYPVPDSVEWVIPDEAEIIEETDDFLMMVFNNPGIYQVGYFGYLGYCVDNYESEVEILSKDDGSTGGRIFGAGARITSLEAYPNPNNGHFTLKGQFSDKMNVSLRAINLTLNATVLEKMVQVEGEQSWEFDLSGYPKGLYAIIIESKNHLKAVRIIVN
ncbi:MAG: T9SS type A sorting domain-containing protein, partial [Bacteroidota bacterium]